MARVRRRQKEESMSKQSESMLKLQARVETILDKSGTHTPEDLRTAANILEAMADILEEESEDNYSSSERFSYGKYAVSYLRTHYMEQISVGDLARKIGISRSYLTQVVNEEVGMSPQEYLIGIRLEHAKLHLENSSKKIRDIAISCGYEDPLNFSKAFKAKYGASPSAYRKEHCLSHSTEDKEDVE